MAAILGQLRPNRGTFTAVAEHDPKTKWVGQFSYDHGERFARLSFVLPKSDLADEDFVRLFEYLSKVAGEWGAFSILAEAADASQEKNRLLQAGYACYGWLQIWKIIPRTIDRERTTPGWQICNEEDQLAVKLFTHQHFALQRQFTESFPKNLNNSRVLKEKNEVIAWADCQFGIHGIFVKPVLKPNLESAAEVIQLLVSQLWQEFGLPVYVAVPSFQEWVNQAIEILGGQTWPRQSLFVKRMAQKIKEEVPSPLLNVIPKNNMGTTSPVGTKIWQPDTSEQRINSRIKV